MIRKNHPGGEDCDYIGQLHEDLIVKDDYYFFVFDRNGSNFITKIILNMPIIKVGLLIV